jgi:3-isopropylmalate dehydratase small subunit
MRRPAMTLTQKILAAHAIGPARAYIAAGDVLRIRADWTMLSELAWNGMERTYDALGRPPLHDPERCFVAVDHTVDPVTLAGDPDTQRLVERARSFAREAGLRHFYEANETILHTLFYRALVQPGEVVIGADSHTSSHGGLGAFAIGLGGADVTVAMVLGETWIQVPEAIAVEYVGAPGFGIGGKDIVLHTLKLLGRNTVALERSVEYRGEATRSFSPDMRFTIANMTAELGGLNGVFEADETVARWLARRHSHADRAAYFRADPDAPYVDRFPIALGGLAPQVAKPFSPDNVFDVGQVVGQPIDGCFIGACTTTEEELVLGALVIEQALAAGLRPAPRAGDKRIVVPGDVAIRANLRAAELWSVYERAGFVVDPPGCSMCLGLASRKAAQNEVWLSSQNRNFRNRMGEGSLAWLASAATVAASALSMEITDPRPFLARIDQDRFARILRRGSLGAPAQIRISEPPTHVTDAPGVDAGPQQAGPAASVVVGTVQRFGDAVDTDAIIPGQFCNIRTIEETGEHCFQFVRPEFVTRARAGATIVVAGTGWGTGSSREHAAWALLGAGVRLIIARSYAYIHRRNLVNEGLPHLVVDDPDFYDLVQEGSTLQVDLSTGTIRELASRQVFQAKNASSLLRSMQADGGLVSAVQRHGTQVFAQVALSDHGVADPGHQPEAARPEAIGRARS